MLRIAALNESDSSNEEEDEQDEPTTKEAEEAEAFALYNRALGLQRSGDGEGAEELFRSLLQHPFLLKAQKIIEAEEEGSHHPGLPLLYLVHKNLAASAVTRGNLVEAMKSYLEAVKIDASEVTVWYKMGTVAKKLHNYPLAKLAFEQSLQCNENHWPSLDAVITVLYALNDYWVCLDYCAQALERDPYYTKGLVFMRQVLKEQPSLLKTTKEIFASCDPIIHTVTVEPSEAEKMIQECVEIRNKRRELAKKPDPPPLKLPKPITQLTWKCVGECLVELYDNFTASDPPKSVVLSLDMSEYTAMAEGKADELATTTTTAPTVLPSQSQTTTTTTTTTTAVSASTTGVTTTAGHVTPSSNEEKMETESPPSVLLLCAVQEATKDPERREQMMEVDEGNRPGAVQDESKATTGKVESESKQNAAGAGAAEVKMEEEQAVECREDAGSKRIATSKDISVTLAQNIPGAGTSVSSVPLKKEETECRETSPVPLNTSSTFAKSSTAALTSEAAAKEPAAGVSPVKTDVSSQRLPHPVSVISAPVVLTCSIPASPVSTPLLVVTSPASSAGANSVPVEEKTWGDASSGLLVKVSIPALAPASPSSTAAVCTSAVSSSPRSVVSQAVSPTKRVGGSGSPHKTETPAKAASGEDLGVTSCVGGTEKTDTRVQPQESSLAGQLKVEVETPSVPTPSSEVKGSHLSPGAAVGHTSPRRGQLVVGGAVTHSSLVAMTSVSPTRPPSDDHSYPTRMDVSTVVTTSAAAPPVFSATVSGSSPNLNPSLARPLTSPSLPKFQFSTITPKEVQALLQDCVPTTPLLSSPAPSPYSSSLVERLKKSSPPTPSATTSSPTSSTASAHLQSLARLATSTGEVPSPLLQPSEQAGSGDAASRVSPSKQSSPNSSATVSAEVALQDHVGLGKGAKGSRRGTKRKRAPVERRSNVIGPEDYGIKRRSARVRNTRKEEENVDFQKLLLKFLPSSLTQSVPVEEESQVDDTHMSLSQAPLDVGMRELCGGPPLEDTEKEDVRAYLKECLKRQGVVGLMYKYLVFLSSRDSRLWPAGVADLYLKVYERVRDHLTFPSLFCMDFPEICYTEMCKMALVWSELTLDAFLVKRANTVVSPAMSQRQGEASVSECSVFTEEHSEEDLLFLTGVVESGLVELLGDQQAQFTIRVYWMKGRLALAENHMDKAVETLDLVGDCLREEDAVSKVYLPNCCQDKVISLEEVKRQQESLQRCQSLEESQRLFDAGQYQQVVDSLCSTFAPAQFTHHGLKPALPERHAQLELLQDALYRLEDWGKCLLWGEESLNEALHHYRRAPTVTTRESWSVTLVRLFEGLQRVINKGIQAVSSMPLRSIIRLTHNLMRIIEINHDVSEAVTDMPIASVLPWILLYRIIKHEEDKLETRKIADEDSPDSSQGTMSSSLMLLSVAHEYLGRNAWCTNEGGIFLQFYLDILTKELPKAHHSVKEDLETAFEQCVLCLYAHPNKKGKARHLYDHNASSIDLTWEQCPVVFDYFKPKSLPEFDSYKTSTVSAELENLLRRICSLIPESEEMSKRVDEVHDYIEGNTNTAPGFSTDSAVQGELYYLLADYYFKNKEQTKAIKFYTYDVCFNSGRIDSWAGLALAKMYQLEQKLNSMELKIDAPVHKKSIAALRCFSRAVEVDESVRKLWIEYGSLAYQLHSHASRQLRMKLWFPLTTELLEIAVETRVEMLATARNCYWKASKCEADGSEEEWLHHYMMGKVMEKQRAHPRLYLEHYKQAAIYLHEEEAKYPRKIMYHVSPPHLSLEALEMYYRLHVAVMKHLLRISMPETKDDMTLFDRYITEATESPFALRKEKHYEIRESASSADDSQGSVASVPPYSTTHQKPVYHMTPQDHNYSKQKSSGGETSDASCEVKEIGMETDGSQSCEEREASERDSGKIGAAQRRETGSSRADRDRDQQSTQVEMMELHAETDSQVSAPFADTKPLLFDKQLSGGFIPMLDKDLSLTGTSPAPPQLTPSLHTTTTASTATSSATATTCTTGKRHQDLNTTSTSKTDGPMLLTDKIRGDVHMKDSRQHGEGEHVGTKRMLGAGAGVEPATPSAQQTAVKVSEETETHDDKGRGGTPAPDPNTSRSHSEVVFLSSDEPSQDEAEETASAKFSDNSVVIVSSEDEAAARISPQKRPLKPPLLPSKMARLDAAGASTVAGDRGKLEANPALPSERGDGFGVGECSDVSMLKEKKEGGTDRHGKMGEEARSTGQVEETTQQVRAQQIQEKIDQVEQRTEKTAEQEEKTCTRDKAEEQEEESQRQAGTVKEATELAEEQTEKTTTQAEEGARPVRNTTEQTENTTTEIMEVDEPEDLMTAQKRQPSPTTLPVPQSSVSAPHVEETPVCISAESEQRQVGTAESAAMTNQSSGEDAMGKVKEGDSVKAQVKSGTTPEPQLKPDVAKNSGTVPVDPAETLTDTAQSMVDTVKTQAETTKLQENTVRTQRDTETVQASTVKSEAEGSRGGGVPEKSQPMDVEASPETQKTASVGAGRLEQEPESTGRIMCAEDTASKLAQVKQTAESLQLHQKASESDQADQKVTQWNKPGQKPSELIESEQAVPKTDQPEPKAPETVRPDEKEAASPEPGRKDSDGQTEINRDTELPQHTAVPVPSQSEPKPPSQPEQEALASKQSEKSMPAPKTPAQSTSAPKQSRQSTIALTQTEQTTSVPKQTEKSTSATKHTEQSSSAPKTAQGTSAPNQLEQRAPGQHDHGSAASAAVLEEKEYKVWKKSLLDKCIEGLHVCLSRFPTHYKSIYRLAYLYYASDSHRNLECARDLLLGNADWQTLTHMPANGLFSDRRNNNFFNGMWKIPIDEIDRSGSFASHVNRSVQLLLEVLRDMGDVSMLHTLHGQLKKKPPDQGRKYLRDGERQILAQMAHSYMLDAVAGQLSHPDSEVKDKTEVLLSAFKAYNAHRLGMESKRAMMMLIAAYQRLRLPQHGFGTPLEQAVQYCNSVIVSQTQAQKAEKQRLLSQSQSSASSSAFPATTPSFHTMDTGTAPTTAPSTGAKPFPHHSSASHNMSSLSEKGQSQPGVSATHHASHSSSAFTASGVQASTLRPAHGVRPRSVSMSRGDVPAALDLSSMNTQRTTSAAMDLSSSLNRQAAFENPTSPVRRVTHGSSQGLSHNVIDLTSPERSSGPVRPLPATPPVPRLQSNISAMTPPSFSRGEITARPHDAAAKTAVKEPVIDLTASPDQGKSPAMARGVTSMRGGYPNPQQQQGMMGQSTPPRPRYHSSPFSSPLAFNPSSSTTSTPRVPTTSTADEASDADLHSEQEDDLALTSPDKLTSDVRHHFHRGLL